MIMARWTFRFGKRDGSRKGTRRTAASPSYIFAERGCQLSGGGFRVFGDVCAGLTVLRENRCRPTGGEVNFKYSLTRAPAGTVTTIVSTPPRPNRGNVPPPPRGKPPPEATPQVQLPTRYADHDGSGLTYTVQPGEQEHDVRIEERAPAR
jgi:hypothetical protein